MSNNELLLQISELLDVKLQATESRLREEIQQVKTELQGEIQQVKTELQGEIQQVKTELQGEIQQVKTELQELKMCVENNVIPRLQNIEKCYTDTYDRYRIEIEKVNALEADVDILKKVVHEHSEKLKAIS